MLSVAKALVAPPGYEAADKHWQVVVKDLSQVTHQTAAFAAPVSEWLGYMQIEYQYVQAAYMTVYYRCAKATKKP
jgi:hypothetical protein